MSRVAKALNGVMGKFGFEVRRRPEKKTLSLPRILDEFSKEEVEIAEYILSKSLTVVSPMRLFATMSAVKFSIEQDISGDFVECGVWRGGNSIAAALLVDLHSAKKRVFLFDTFAGMTAPDDRDFYIVDGAPAMPKFLENQRADHNDWVYSPLSEVKQNFLDAGVELDGIVFVQGPVEKTLLEKENLPEKISTLRLDTDWYSSTLLELQVLYPRLASRGSLLIDDYGSWDGARRATNDYFQSLAPSDRPTLFAVDYDGRAATKATSSGKS